MAEKKEEMKTLAQRMKECLVEAGNVEKRGFNSFQNYKYVMEADVADAVRAAFIKNGIIFLPSIEDMQSTQVAVEAKGTTRHAFQVTVKVRFALVNADDPTDRIELIGFGQGLDQGDKALPKAMTMAQKYMLMKLFLMGTDDDAENPHKEVQSDGPAPTTAQPRAQQGASSPQGMRGESPRTPEEWTAYWSQYPYEYDIPYKEGQAASIKEALREAKAKFRGGKNRDKSDNGDIDANKHWYTDVRIPGFERYLVGNQPQVSPGAPAQKDLSFAEDDIPF